MSPAPIRRLAAGLLLLALAAPLGAQSSFAWWKSEQFQKDLGLTAEQCARIDSVFQATLPKLREGREELDRDEAELSRLIDQNVEIAIFAFFLGVRELHRNASRELLAKGSLLALKALLMRVQEEMSYEEIGEALNLAPATVKVRFTISSPLEFSTPESSRSGSSFFNSGPSKIPSTVHISEPVRTRVLSARSPRRS